jgi:hypothetical protein
MCCSSNGVGLVLDRLLPRASSSAFIWSVKRSTIWSDSSSGRWFLPSLDGTPPSGPVKWSPVRSLKLYITTVCASSWSSSSSLLLSWSSSLLLSSSSPSPLLSSSPVAAAVQQGQSQCGRRVVSAVRLRRRLPQGCGARGGNSQLASEFLHVFQHS